MILLHSFFYFDLVYDLSWSMVALLPANRVVECVSRRPYLFLQIKMIQIKWSIQAQKVK
jgi:hypothetical protein